MESLSDIINNELLGKPFRPWGRGPKTFDCLGVWIYLVRRVTGRYIPDIRPKNAGYFDPYDVMAMRNLLADMLVVLPVAEELKPLDMLHRRRPECHIFTVENEKYVIQAEYGSVGRILLEDVLRMHGLIRYRLREAA